MSPRVTRASLIYKAKAPRVADLVADRPGHGDDQHPGDVVRCWRYPTPCVDPWRCEREGCGLTAPPPAQTPRPRSPDRGGPLQRNRPLRFCANPSIDLYSNCN
jgi:hypothetical protein